MNRYRTYAQEDDPPLEEGDKFFVGVNQFDIAENLVPGQVQAATNMDFTDATAKTRGGFICLPALASAPFSAGKPWIARASDVAQTWSGIAYGNSRYVAVNTSGAGTNDVMYSPNGITWTLVSSGVPGGWNAVTFANGKFVAVASTGSAGHRAMTSPDGITWTAQVTPADISWYAIAYGSNTFVAVAIDGGSQQAMTSTDGVTWTLQNTDASAQNGWFGLTFGNGLFVAVANTGTGNRVMTSPDGVTWTARASAANTSWHGVIYGSGTYVSVSLNGGTSSVMTSPDGITWTLRTTPSSDWLAIAYGNHQFIAVGAAASAAGAAMTSPDGITWTASTGPNTNTWFAVAFGLDQFAAVAQTGVSSRVMTLNAINVFASGVYSDPSATSAPWIVLCGPVSAGFYAFGQTARAVPYPSGVMISQQSTVVQANNFLFIFPGSGQTPLRWDGAWGGSFITAPASTLGAGFQNIPQSNQATYYQNRLWVVNGKDTESASQNLDFQNFNVLAAAFNLNVGTSDYLIASYPFGDNSLVVFKKNSVYLLQNVDGALTDVTSTEITRQLGITGINACVSVGPDIVFMTDRNITTVRLSIQNALQAVTIPLSQNINPIIRRVNWSVANKISMGYSNNLLFVALPLDNATVCSAIIVYNFITQQWYGEWNFTSSINMSVQGFVRANYLGQIRLHVVTEDGRIFVTDQGQNDISGTIVAEISTSMTTRAYRLDNNSHIPRRMYMDLGTNRPNFTATAYAEGASESSAILSGQTYSRSNSWLFNNSAYTLTNANNDFNRAFRQDYSTGPSSIQCGTGFQPEMTQDYRFPIITRRKGRLSWFQVDNTTGYIRVNGIGVEARPGDRSNFVQVG